MASLQSKAYWAVQTELLAALLNNIPSDFSLLIQKPITPLSEGLVLHAVARDTLTALSCWMDPGSSAEIRRCDRADSLNGCGYKNKLMFISQTFNKRLQEILKHCRRLYDTAKDDYCVAAGYFVAALNSSEQYTVIPYNAAWCIRPLLSWQSCNLQFRAKVL